MSYSVVVKIGLACFLATLFAHSIAPVASAQDTNVSAIICNSSPATLTINQPLTDSIIANVPIAISGSLSQVNQIEFFVDGQLDSVLAVPAAATTYSYELSLLAGTHTVKLVAYDVCGGPNSDTSLVVTYQPTVTPSEGGTTVTELPSEGGVIIKAATGDTVDVEAPSFFKKYVSIPVANIAHGLDLYGEGSSAQTPRAVDSIGRFVLFTAGIAVALASFIQFAVANVAQQVAHSRLLRNFSGHGQIRVGMRIIGLFLVALVFLI